MNKPEKLPAVGDLIEILRGDGSRGQVRPVTSTFECCMFLLEGIVRPFHVLNEDLSWRRAGVVPAWDPKTGPLGDVSLGFIQNLKAGDREKLAMRMGLPFDAEPEAIWRAMMLDAAKGTAFDPAICGSMGPSASGQIHITFCLLPSKHEGPHTWAEGTSGSSPVHPAPLSPQNQSDSGTAPEQRSVRSHSGGPKSEPPHWFGPALEAAQRADFESHMLGCAACLASTCALELCDDGKSLGRPLGLLPDGLVAAAAQGGGSVRAPFPPGSAVACGCGSQVWLEGGAIPPGRMACEACGTERAQPVTGGGSTALTCDDVGCRCDDPSSPEAAELRRRAAASAEAEPQGACPSCRKGLGYDGLCWSRACPAFVLSGKATCHSLAPTGYASCQLQKGHDGDHSAEFRWPSAQEKA